MPTPDVRRDIGKEARLWGLAVICAAAGAIAVSRTDSFGIGVLVFLAALGVCGPILFTYEKRRKAKQADGDAPRSDRGGQVRDRSKHGGHRKRPPKR